MTRICHLTTVHNALDDRIFYKECCSLAKKVGYEVFLVARGESRKIEGVKIEGIGKAHQNRLMRMICFAFRLYKRALELDAEVYHIHDPELLPWALLLKWHKKKVIFDSHENYGLQIGEKGYLPKTVRGLAKRIYLKAENYVLRRIDAGITPCTFYGVDIFEGRVKRSVIIDNYPVDSEFYDKYDKNSLKEGYFCHMGGLTEDRGVTDIVRAAIKAKVKLVLAGSINEAYLEKLKSIPGFSKWIVYEGCLNREAVCDVYKKAIAGVFVLRMVGQYGRSDNFGIKVTEFMAMGLPFVIAKYPATEKLEKEWRCCLIVKSGDVNEIANAMRWIVEHPKEAQVMGERGRKAVKEKYNWEHEEKKLLELYEKVLM